MELGNPMSVEGRAVGPVRGATVQLGELEEIKAQAETADKLSVQSFHRCGPARRRAADLFRAVRLSCCGGVHQ